MDKFYFHVRFQGVIIRLQKEKTQSVLLPGGRYCAKVIAGHVMALGSSDRIAYAINMYLNEEVNSGH